MIRTVRITHRFLAGQSFYALGLCTLLCFGFVAGRYALSGRTTFAFMVWNLFLAWVPYLCSLAALALYRRHPLARGLAFLPAALWLAFLPNAPYMVTDLLHLDPRPPVPYWYDVGLLASFVLTGLFLAFASLRVMQSIADRIGGRVVGWLFVIATLGLSGFGIYLGRFMKLNSWDIVAQPDDVLLTVARRILYPSSQTYGVTLMFAAMLFVFYVAFLSAQKPPRLEAE